MIRNLVAVLASGALLAAAGPAFAHTHANEGPVTAPTTTEGPGTTQQAEDRKDSDSGERKEQQ